MSLDGDKAVPSNFVTWDSNLVTLACTLDDLPTVVIHQ